MRLPDGAITGNRNRALHERTLDLAEREGCSYETALDRCLMQVRAAEFGGATAASPDGAQPRAADLNDIHVLRVGSFEASNGDRVVITDDSLREIAETYDTNRHEAPAVIGHPTTNAPAYGWVSDVRHRDGGLYVAMTQVVPKFREALQAGRYKKVSASLYMPGAPNHPMGANARGYYLRHVGFLGAQAPAVKGLEQAQFSDEARDFTECPALTAPPASRAELHARVLARQSRTGKPYNEALSEEIA